VPLITFSSHCQGLSGPWALQGGPPRSILGSHPRTSGALQGLLRTPSGPPRSPAATISSPSPPREPVAFGLNQRLALRPLAADPWAAWLERPTSSIQSTSTFLGRDMYQRHTADSCRGMAFTTAMPAGRTSITLSTSTQRSTTRASGIGSGTTCLITRLKRSSIPASTTGATIGTPRGEQHNRRRRIARPGQQQWRRRCRPRAPQEEERRSLRPRRRRRRCRPRAPPQERRRSPRPASPRARGSLAPRRHILLVSPRARRLAPRRPLPARMSSPRCAV